MIFDIGGVHVNLYPLAICLAVLLAYCVVSLSVASLRRSQISKAFELGKNDNKFIRGCMGMINFFARNNSPKVREYYNYYCVLLADAYLQQGKPEMFLETLQKIKEYFGASEDWVHLLLLSYLYEKFLREVLSEYRKVLTADIPQDQRPHTWRMKHLLETYGWNEEMDAKAARMSEQIKNEYVLSSLNSIMQMR